MSALKNELINIREDASQLDRACRSQWGISARMFRTVKFVFYITTLLSMAYLVEAGVEPFTAMAFAALLITGPEGLEMWLVHQGKLPDPHDSDGED